MAKILLVDDEEIVLKSISALLKGEGHETVACTSVPDALEARKAETFDLIITDIRMAPIDGMEFIRIIHAEDPDFPIIVVSAYTSEKVMEEGYRLGCSHYLAKPFRVQDVLDAVDSALAK
jgi:two-component system response regulator PilR (NtrC family)